MFSRNFQALRKKCPYSVRMRENADQNNSEYGQFLRSEGLQYSGAFSDSL